MPIKLPAPPPDVDQFFRLLAGNPDEQQRALRVLANSVGPTPGGKYLTWEEFRYQPHDDAITAEDHWFSAKLARRAMYRKLPMTDAKGRPFQFALPNVILELLHRIDRDASGRIQASAQVTSPSTRDTYLIKALVEEAITSSQLEGASTTRQVAKAMIQEGRPPSDRSERMILNNYHAMQLVRTQIDSPLTPEFVLALQRVLTVDTLDDPSASGRLRRASELIHVTDEIGTVLHIPPLASEIGSRLESLCGFANGMPAEGEFIHPVVRAVMLHFWLAYDHPFVDGNGRTARALFYWSMARQGYWLAEYISISRILKKARAQYARAFLYTESDDNDATHFLLYQLRVIVQAIADLHVFLERKSAQLAKTEELLHRAAFRDALNHRQLALLTHAMKRSDARYTILSHRRSHGVSRETARHDLLDLTGQELLEMSKRGREFIFRPTPGLTDLIHQRAAGSI